MIRFNEVHKVLLLIFTGAKHLAQQKAKELTEDELSFLETKVPSLQNLAGVVSPERVTKLLEVLVTAAEGTEADKDLVMKKYLLARHGINDFLLSQTIGDTMVEQGHINMSEALVIRLLKLKGYWVLRGYGLTKRVWETIMKVTQSHSDFWRLQAKLPMKDWPWEEFTQEFMVGLLENLDLEGTPLQHLLWRVSPGNLNQVKRQSGIASDSVTLENLKAAIDAHGAPREGVAEFIKMNNTHWKVREIVLEAAAHGTDYTKYLQVINDDEIDFVLELAAKNSESLEAYEY